MAVHESFDADMLVFEKAEMEMRIAANLACDYLMSNDPDRARSWAVKHVEAEKVRDAILDKWRLERDAAAAGRGGDV